MADWKKLVLIVVAIGAWGLWISHSAVLAQEAKGQGATPAPAVTEDAMLDDEADIANLVSIQGEVTAVDAKANTVAIKDPNVKDPATATKTLVIDPKTTTIWGEYDEIKLTDLAAGTKVAGEYKLNPNGSMTATYLEIVLDEEAELPPLEESQEAAKEKPAEKPVE